LLAQGKYKCLVHGADVREITVDGAPVSVADGVVVLENAASDFYLEAEIV
jgi:hypothetical protein